MEAILNQTAMQFTQRMDNIKVSATLSFDAYAKKLKSTGQDITMFTAGQPDYNPPQKLIEATINAAKTEKHFYTAVLGIAKLRENVANYLTKYNLNYQPNEIAITVGVKGGLTNAILITAGPGDEIIHPNIRWGSYIDQIKIAAATPVAARTNHEFKMLAEHIKEVLTPASKVVIINSPSNPTGAVYTREDLVDIAKLAVEHNLIVISDEIYSEIIYDGSHYSIAALEKEVPGIRNLTITLNGASKAVAIPGWRIGYLAAPAEVIEKIDAIQGASTSNATSLCQFALAEVLAEDFKSELADYLQEKVKLLKTRRDKFLAGLKQINYNSQPAFQVDTPAGAFYLWVNIKNIKNEKFGQTSKEIQENLLNQSGIAITNGAAFGNDDFLRFSYAVDESEIERGLDKLQNYLK